MNQTTIATEALPELDQLCSIVVDIARQEGLERLQRHLRDYKADGSVVTDTDTRLQARILGELKERWPAFGALGEEMELVEQTQVVASSRTGFWVLDPLDGTTNFTAGFPFFGISLALIENGEPQLAVVYDPVRDECFSAGKGGGAWLNGNRLQASDETELKGCIANIDYKRLIADLAERLVSSPPYRSQRNLGACVLEWCWLAAGRMQLYLHGGQRLWDYAAGYLILEEAGGKAWTLDGKPLSCDKLSKRSVVAAANPQLFDLWFEWIRRNTRHLV